MLYKGKYFWVGHRPQGHTHDQVNHEGKLQGQTQIAMRKVLIPNLTW